MERDTIKDSIMNLLSTEVQDLEGGCGLTIGLQDRNKYASICSYIIWDEMAPVHH